MDNEYNYNAYEYGNKSNIEPEPVNKETLQEVTQSTVQDSAENIQQPTEQSVAEENASEAGAVNFVMYNPEPEKAVEEPEAESPTGAQTVYSEAPKAEQKVEDSVYSYSYVKQEQPVKSKKTKKKSGTGKKWVLSICLAIVFGLVASVVFQASNFFIGEFLGNGSREPGKTVSTTQTTHNGNKELTDVAQVAANVMPSVVSITNLTVQEVQNFFFGGTTIQEYESSGSGIIIGQNDSELLIVSNNHVVEGSSTLTVSFTDGASVEAKIKGTDADIDLAIVAVPLSSISNETLDAIKVATLGDSDKLSVGEPAIAIGNALGYGQSVTCGIISALDREIEGFDSELIQTDAAINPGNSGGALLNSNGEVIGINTVKVSADAVEGMGYAIPISDVNDIINDLMNRETREKVQEAKRGTIGIQGISVDENTSKLYGLPQGVQISDIIKGGAAEKAGIPKKSIITKFDGTRINSMDDLQGQLEYYEAGEKVEIVVEVIDEKGEYVEKTYEITLSKRSILD